VHLLHVLFNGILIHDYLLLVSALVSSSLFLKIKQVIAWNYGGIIIIVMITIIIIFYYAKMQQT